MSYYAQHLMAFDQALNGRVIAAVASENMAGNTDENPEQWTANNRYYWCSPADWSSAWDSALAAENPDPGADAGVITDQMILSSVQSLL